jgi:hypothetical protein
MGSKVQRGMRLCLDLAPPQLIPFALLLCIDLGARQ